MEARRESCMEAVSLAMTRARKKLAIRAVFAAASFVAVAVTAARWTDIRARSHLSSLRSAQPGDRIATAERIAKQGASGTRALEWLTFQTGLCSGSGDELSLRQVALDTLWRCDSSRTDSRLALYVTLGRGLDRDEVLTILKQREWASLEPMLRAAVADALVNDADPRWAAAALNLTGSGLRLNGTLHNEAVEALRRAAIHCRHSSVRANVAVVLSALGDSARSVLLDMLADPDFDVRLRAASVLASRLHDASGLDVLVSGLSSRASPSQRSVSAHGLGRLGDRRTIHALAVAYDTLRRDQEDTSGGQLAKLNEALELITGAALEPGQSEWMTWVEQHRYQLPTQIVARE